MSTSPAPSVTSRSPSPRCRASIARASSRRRKPPDRAPGGVVGGGVGHELAGDARQLAFRALARRVDVEHDHHVGKRERAAELAVQVERARVEVGLEGGDQALRRKLARRPQRGLDLGRVMGVVVDDARAVAGADRLEAAARRAGSGRGRAPPARDRSRPPRRRRARPARSARCALRAPAAPPGRPARLRARAGSARPRRSARPPARTASRPGRARIVSSAPPGRSPQPAPPPTARRCRPRAGAPGTLETPPPAPARDP